ncbi:MAG: hypothetical protein ACREM6_04185 [Vulcanimicrobiaceae bacterium]
MHAGSLTVIAATGLEARAARAALPGLHVVRAGVALTRIRDGRCGAFETVVSCGLAGGLRDDLPTGTVLIPTEVTRPTGERLICDPELCAALCAAARELGFEPVVAPLITSAGLVRGAARRSLAQRYAGVDMETGMIQARRIAAVRVVLDTPQHELSGAWLRPWTAFAYPQAWRELPWLAREAPRCARIAAQVVAAALTAPTANVATSGRRNEG